MLGEPHEDPEACECGHHVLEHEGNGGKCKILGCSCSHFTNILVEHDAEIAELESKNALLKEKVKDLDEIASLLGFDEYDSGNINAKIVVLKAKDEEITKKDRIINDSINHLLANHPEMKGIGLDDDLFGLVSQITTDFIEVKDAADDLENIEGILAPFSDKWSDIEGDKPVFWEWVVQELGKATKWENLGEAAKEWEGMMAAHHPRTLKKIKNPTEEFAVINLKSEYWDEISGRFFTHGYENTDTPDGIMHEYEERMMEKDNEITHLKNEKEYLSRGLFLKCPDCGGELKTYHYPCFLEPELKFWQSCLSCGKRFEEKEPSPSSERKGEKNDVK